MAKGDGGNGATADEVKQAFNDIIGHYEDLATERGTYMQRCREIRGQMVDIYAAAAERGITRRVLKAKIKEHLAQEKLLAIREELEPDDRNEFDQLTEVLGDFGGTPLGAAALDRVKRAETLDDLTQQ